MKNSCLYDERWNPNDDVVGDIRKNITNMVLMLVTSELVSKIAIRLHVFPILVKVGRKVRKISSSLQYYEVEISFQVTIFLSSLDDDTK
jgi:hypothetical protein